MLFLFFHKTKKAPAANYTTSDFDNVPFRYRPHSLFNKKPLLCVSVPDKPGNCNSPIPLGDLSSYQLLAEPDEYVRVHLHKGTNNNGGARPPRLRLFG